MYHRSAIWTFVVLLGLSSWHSILAENSQGADTEQVQALSKFFGSIDRDGDGQIQPSEALSYIGANFDDREIAADKTAAAEWVYENLEGNDTDATISKAEVEKHLKRLLKGNRVSEWLKHSAQMPQYVQAFRDNQVTSLDFPILVSDGGRILENDLGVKSKLHQEQLVRALKRVILGIGTTPSLPQEFRCQALACNQIALTWSAPKQAGNPPMHKYKLERMLAASGLEVAQASVWETANSDLNDEDTSWLDTGLQVGTYRYRLTAWNSVGWSEYAFSPDCDASDTSLVCHKSPAVSKQHETNEDQLAAFIQGVQQRGLVISTGLALVLAIVFRWSQTHRKHRAAREDQILGQDSALGDSGRSDATATVTTIVEPKTESAFEQLESRSASLKTARLPSSSQEVPTEIIPEPSRSSSPSKIGRGSMLLADADCFMPGQVDSLRAASSSRKTNGLRDQEALGLRLESNVIWLDSEGRETSAPPEMERVLTPEVGDRHTCAFPGCQKSLRVVFNPKAAMTSHYCNLCQNVFCHHHTKYSPHGMLGSCGLDSKCVCQICFDDLPRLTQSRLEKSNKIHRTPKKDKEDGSKMKRDHSRRSLTDKPGSVSGGSSNSLPMLSRSGEEHWAKLRTAWKAVKRFQGAGNERRQRFSEDGVPQ